MHLVLFFFLDDVESVKLSYAWLVSGNFSAAYLCQHAFLVVIVLGGVKGVNNSSTSVRHLAPPVQDTWCLEVWDQPPVHEFAPPWATLVLALGRVINIAWLLNTPYHNLCGHLTVRVVFLKYINGYTWLCMKLCVV